MVERSRFLARWLSRTVGDDLTTRGARKVDLDSQRLERHAAVEPTKALYSLHPNERRPGILSRAWVRTTQAHAWRNAGVCLR
eukprot:5935974-Heterocapsa_arctica.AAC.1